MIGRLLPVWLCLCILWPCAALADSAPFDLAGPSLKVRVSHAGVTLPIAEVPNLSPGDQVSIAADLPPSQSVHYLLVAAVRRGAPHPPPEAGLFSAAPRPRTGPRRVEAGRTP